MLERLAGIEKRFGDTFSKNERIHFTNQDIDKAKADR